MSSKSKKKSRKPKKLSERFRANLSRYGLPGTAKIIRNPAGQVKMSEVLVDFIEPYSMSVRTEEEYQKLLSVALIAWNAALLPPNGRQEMIDSIIGKAIPADSADDAKLVIHELIRRKDRYFADIKRSILLYELTMTKEGPHISVASTL